MNDRPDERPCAERAVSRAAPSERTTDVSIEELVASELADVVLDARPDPGCGVWHEFWGREPSTDESRLLRVRLRAPGDHDVAHQVLQAARQLRAASHPSVLPVDRFGCTNRLLWLTLHAVPGGGLRDWLESGAAPSTSQAHEFLNLVSAPVMAMHADGWVHGALMPEVFHQGHDGAMRICCPWIDAQLVGADVAGGVDVEALMCCAPEVRAGFAPSRHSDVYSVAALLVRLLCGRFPGPSGELPRGVVPGVWSRTLGRALSPNPRSRFSGIDELLRALGPTSVVGSGSARTRADGVALPRPRRPPGGIAARPSAGVRLHFLAGKARAGGRAIFAAPRKVSRARRVCGALILVTLTVALAAANGSTPEDLALAFSAAASTVEARWSGIPRPEAEAVAEPQGVHETGPFNALAAYEPDSQESSSPRVPVALAPQDTGAAPHGAEELEGGSVGSAVADAGRADSPASSSGAPASEGSPSGDPPAETSPTRGSEPIDQNGAGETPAGEVFATLAPARLSLQSYPWARVYIDGAYVGTTPVLDLQVDAGAHIVRIERPDRLPYVRSLTFAPGQEIRLTGIVLDRGPP